MDIAISQALPFDVGALAADLPGLLGDLANAFTIKAVSSSHVVIQATAATPFAGYQLEILPETSFGLTFSPPYFTGAIGGLRVLDPNGVVVVSVSDLPHGLDLDSLTNADFLTSLAADIHGSAGADSITGHTGADLIDGGAGDDVIAGGVGLNYLRGGDGADQVTGGASFDDINGNQGNDTASGGAGDDGVVGGKDDDRLSGDAGSDIVYGNLGSDTCDGGDGSDLIRGGQGNDVLTGGAGNDWLSGDKGDDTLTGGAGADVFHSFGEAGLDRVTDFNAAEGDRVMLDPGTTYTVSQVGADTVIAMAGGGQMVLVGVQLSGLPTGWLFGA
jgi:Ca2+-binding RTX toxin-like protein